MKAFGGAGVGRPETKAERRELARARAKRARSAIAALPNREKIRALGRAVAGAFVARGTVTTLDLTQAGFSEAEAKMLYDDALELAKTIEPGICAAVCA